MSDSDELSLAEILYESGEVHFRYARVLSKDGERWIRHGLFVEYGKRGQVISEGHYDNGVEQGLWRDFHANGQIAAQGEYAGGTEHGVWRYWSEDGAEESSVEYIHGRANA